tara:strand:+ start:218 stop:2314 length:2097 start_codon:yes stop_codon:yes gene_type:complete
MEKGSINSLLVVLMLIAVGGFAILSDNGSNSDSSSDDGENQQMEDEWDVYYVDSGEDLPACGSATLGRLYFVASTAGFETCTSSGWAFVNLTGPAGVPGNDGADGGNGFDGANGLSAMATTTSEPPSSNCPEGGVQIDVGMDDDGDGILTAIEIDQTTYICNGLDGADGVNGSASPHTMLTSVSSPAAVLGCTAGGRVIAQGLDNGDGGGGIQNGILESGEIDYTTIYCSKYEVWQVADIRSGEGSSSPGTAGMEILVGDTIYFSAYDDATGFELWAHDTSNSSTWQVADLNRNLNGGTGSSAPGNNIQILVGDTIYFDAAYEYDWQWNDVWGSELWAHDTSNSSTWRVTYFPGTYSHETWIGDKIQILVEDTIYFDAEGDDGFEIWAHNTSNSSTWQVTDINTRTDYTGSDPGFYGDILVGDTIYFSAWDGFNGSELWAHDTSNSSTWMVADINSGGTSNPLMGLAILVGDTIYFDADDGVNGRQMWAHDISNSSTWMVTQDIVISEWNTYSILVEDTIYFNADDGISGSELWAHDTSNSSTWQVADIRSGSNGCTLALYSWIILIGDTIYFTADDGVSGRELWAHDTSNSSTWQVADINPGSEQSWPGRLGEAIVIQDTLYFNVFRQAETGSELWVHDTSNSSTWMVADINNGVGGSDPLMRLAILVGDTLYFNADDGISGSELWAMKIEHSITYN